MKNLLFLIFIAMVLCLGCGTTKRIMKNCEQKSGEFFECEEP